MPVRLRATDRPESLPDLERILLANRALTDREQFFHPPHPSALTSEETGLSAATIAQFQSRLAQAVAQHEEVVIFGDYDADGVCATAILWEALFSLGVRVRPFIPDRFAHGYGLSVKALEQLLAQGKPDVIITVDNGIVAYEALALARSLGVYTIVTDHHQRDAKPLPADLVLHSTKLSGSGVSWLIAHHLAPAAAAQSLELAGLATLADQVPLVVANRSVAHHGLAALRRSKRLGLVELCAVANIKQTEITERTVGFALAPRINAMGRLASALDALRLLCTTSPVRAHNLALMLQDKNVQRQQLTQDLVAQAKLQANQQREQPILVVVSASFHEGVIGLIAGRLVEEYRKPAVVIALGEAAGKGSVRSLPSVDIIATLRLVREHLLELGGHPMAAGFTVQREKIAPFTRALQTIMTESHGAAARDEETLVDCVLPAHLVTLQTAEFLRAFAPYGVENPQPLFQISAVKCLASSLVGKQANHRKYTFEIGGRIITGLQWYSADALATPGQADLTLVASLEVEEWKQKQVQLNVQIIW